MKKSLLLACPPVDPKGVKGVREGTGGKDSSSRPLHLSDPELPNRYSHWFHSRSDSRAVMAVVGKRGCHCSNEHSADQ